MLVKSQIKYIQSLGQKKHRDEAGVFVAEGPKIVAELLAEIPAQIVQLYATTEWVNEYRQKALANEIIIITQDELQRISQLVTPHQVLAIVKKNIAPVVIETSGKWVLALDSIQDPGNLGTIIRIADWFGLEQIVCSHECADMYNPKVVQASMGSIARMKITYIELAAWLEQERESRIYAGMLEGADVRKIEKKGEGVLVVGNESKGISPAVLERVNIQLTIPRVGKAESLNAAVATGILLSYLV